MDRPSGETPTCPDCGSVMVWENKRPRTQRAQFVWRCGRCRYLSASHGLTAEGWRQLVDAQGGMCAICGCEGALVVDHDHSCCRAGKSCPRCRRGLLCNNCNRFLGLAADDPSRLLTGFLYLVDRDTALD